MATANEVINSVLDDHAWEQADMSTNTTPGIQRTLAYHSRAIKALADHIDGKTSASDELPEHAVPPSPQQKKPQRAHA